MAVIDCDNAEEALHVLRRIGDRVSLIFTDVQLSGKINGVELARFSIQCFPNVRVIVNSGFLPTGMLPQGVKFLPKPWLPLDVRREAARLHQLRRPLWQLLAQSRESAMLMHSHTAVPPNPPRTIRAVPEPEIALERLRV